MILSPLFLMLTLSGLLLGFYTIQRLLFLFWNHSYLKEAAWLDILGATLNGIRFDSYAIIVLSSLFIFLSILSSKKIAKIQMIVLAIMNLLMHLPFIILNQIDTEFVNFTSRRLNQGNIALLMEAHGKISSFVTTYFPLIAIQLFIFFVFIFLYFKITQAFRRTLYTTEAKYFILFLVFLIPFLVLCARGGIQRKPLNMTHAIRYNIPHLNLATLNTTFTLIREKTSDFVERKEYFKNKDELLPYLNGYTTSESLFNLDLKNTQTNVVIIILESFAYEYLGRVNGKNFTPFFDKLSQKGLFLDNSYANGFRSIEGIVSILAGIPSYMPEPFVRSHFFNNPIKGVGNYFKDLGYSTSFFHGGRPGTMFFDVFTKRVGFDRYYSSEDYPDPTQDDQIWGIWDEPFFNFFLEKINKEKKPFLSVLFSLTSHHPYKVPKDYEDILPSGELPILKTIAYTDKALENFFKNASKKPWYDNTLFILTADHTALPLLEEYKNVLGRNRIPILLYHPKINFPKVNSQRISQHIDILPSLLDMFNIQDEKSLKFGKSFFNPDPTFNILLYDRTLYFNDDKKIITFLSHQFRKYAREDVNFKNPIPYSESDLLQFKATQQYYNNSLIDGTLYK